MSVNRGKDKDNKQLDRVSVNKHNNYLDHISVEITNHEHNGSVLSNGDVHVHGHADGDSSGKGWRPGDGNLVGGLDQL